MPLGAGRGAPGSRSRGERGCTEKAAFPARHRGGERRASARPREAALGPWLLFPLSSCLATTPLTSNSVTGHPESQIGLSLDSGPEHARPRTAPGPTGDALTPPLAAELAYQSGHISLGTVPPGGYPSGVSQDPSLGPTRLRARPRAGISLPSFMPPREDSYPLHALPCCSRRQGPPWGGGAAMPRPFHSSRCEPPTHTSLSLCRACPQKQG